MRALVPATLLAFGLAVGGAAAQSNTLTIRQSGDGNTLTVDQSRASGSAVGGLTVTGPVPQTFVQIIERPETRQVDRDGTLVTETFTARETQSVVLDTLGASPQRGVPARQLGAGNEATLNVTGLEGFVGLLQDSGSARTGNTATVNLAGGGEALVGQLGSTNTATLNVATGALGGTILQDGTGNDATLNVTGSGATGLISQVGTGLTSNLTVDGTTGTNVSLFQDGVGQAFVGGPGTSVVSNGATVTITQTAIGAAQ